MPAADTRAGTVVKICGLTRPSDARMASSAGAAYVGVIMAGGPRHLEPLAAADVLHDVPGIVRRVGVFGRQSVEEVIDCARRLSLDVVQLHDALPHPDSAGIPPSAQQVVNDVRRIRDATDRAVWLVLRVREDGVAPYWETLAEAADGIVLDAYVPGRLGGTGVALDWTAVRSWRSDFQERFPAKQMILAGGLRPGNVQEAIATLSPDVVDVSSGVETSPGVKDPDAVRRFIEVVQRSSPG